MQQKKRPDAQKSEKNGSALSFLKHLISLKPEISFTIPLIFILLIVFKLIDRLIINKTVENLLLVPFQLTIFLVPAILFVKLKTKKNPIEYLLSLRMHPPRPYHIPLALYSLALMLCGTMLIGLIFAGTDSMESGFSLYSTFVSRVGGGFFSSLFLILAYCAVPAFCEELVFRGMLCREYERFNIPVGIFAGAVFFACLHFDPAQFPVYLFSGILLALTMYAGGSLVVSMIVHLAFNVIGLFGQSYLNAFYHITGGSSGIFVFILVMLTLLFAALFCLSASKCYARRAKRSNMPVRPIFPQLNKLTRILSDIFLNPFIILSFVIYIIVAIVIPFFA